MGALGFAGALVWLAPPLFLLAQGHRHHRPVVGLIGAVLLAFAVMYVPFLQMRFALSGRARALFEFRAVRGDFCRAPVAFVFALFITLLSALPLYALKIEMIPREIVFLESLVFLAFIFPAKLLTGWAVGRAERRTEYRHWFFRWPARLSMLPMAAFYAAVVYFSQHLSWGGIPSIVEQHAFLLPVPFWELRP
jgi:hypothetical protein